jgi:hypothetical protein
VECIYNGKTHRIRAGLEVVLSLGAQITSGAMQMPSYVEANYGTSILEWVRQTYDGRMDFGATTTTTVEDLTGRKLLTLRERVVRYRDSVLAVGAQAAKGSLKE